MFGWKPQAAKQINGVDQAVGHCLDWSPLFGVPKQDSVPQYKFAPKRWPNAGVQKLRQFFGVPVRWQGQSRQKPNKP
jgi:hypothetical protein